MEKLIITAAICGAEVTKAQNPAVPYTVEEITGGAYRIDETATSIEKVPFAETARQGFVYDLMGRKVNTMEKGGIYIVNGKKVIVK